MKNKKYEQLINNILDLVEGQSNITHFTHCMTRLRLNIKDKGLVKVKEIENLEGIAGYQWSGEQLQIIVGSAAGDVFNEICKRHGFQQEQSADESSSNEKKKVSLISLAETISSCITPVLPVMIGGGMLRVILLVGEMMGLLTEASPTYITLSFASEAAFYFLPVFVGAASARKFGLNMWMGMFFGAILLSPILTTMIADGNAGSIFGLPIYAATYSTSIFPIILTVWLASYVERFAKKISPEFLSSMLVPLITILIVVPSMLVVTGPFGAILGNYLTSAVTWLYGTAGFLGISVMGAILPLLVITGMHHSFNPYIFQSFAQFGYEPLVLVITVINNLNQGIASLGVACKTKNKSLKTTATTTGFTALLAGVTEPALFGVTLKHRTPLYAVMIGNAVGGAVAGLLSVVIYAFAGSWGIFALPAFIGENANNFIYMVIAVIVSMIVTFIATVIMFKDEKED